MSVKIEKLEEKNMSRMVIEVPAEELDAAIEKAYQKQKKNIALEGFRKGKVPKNVIIKMFGVSIFYEDAAEILMQQTYQGAMKESGLQIVSQPKVDVVQIEQGKPFIYTADVATQPDVELGNYKGVEITKVDTTVSAAEVNAEVEREREANGRTVSVTDRAIKKGDTAIIDFAGYIDGVQFDGGTATNHALEIGSHSFIDTFEDQLVGKNIDDDVDVNVTFPKDYQAAELAGKKALFKVKIHEIKAKELPALDDEFAQDVSEFDTLKEYKADIKKKLVEGKKDAAKRAQEDEAVQAVVEVSKMDIPQPMIDFQVDEMINGMAQSMAQQGLTIEQYMQFTGTDMEGLRKQAEPEALRRIKGSLVLDAIVTKEKIKVTDKAYEEELKKMSEMYHMELDKLKTLIGEDEEKSIKDDLAIQAAVALILKNAVEVEREEKTEEKPAKKTTKKAAAKEDGEEKPAAKKTTKKTTKKTEE